MVYTFNIIDSRELRPHNFLWLNLIYQVYILWVMNIDFQCYDGTDMYCKISSIIQPLRYSEHIFHIFKCDLIFLKI